MKATGLLPCPFCGGEAKLFRADVPDYMSRSEYIHSVECQACYIGTLFYRLREQAVAAWNRRAPQKDVTP